MFSWLSKPKSTSFNPNDVAQSCKAQFNKLENVLWKLSKGQLRKALVHDGDLAILRDKEVKSCLEDLSVIACNTAEVVKGWFIRRLSSDSEQKLCGAFVFMLVANYCKVSTLDVASAQLRDEEQGSLVADVVYLTIVQLVLNGGNSWPGGPAKYQALSETSFSRFLSASSREDFLASELVVLGNEFKLKFDPRDLRIMLSQTSELYRVAAAKMFEKYKLN